MDIKFNINWQLSNGETLSIDPLLFKLLAEIQQQGSLKKATDKTHVSYRFAWGLLTKWEKFLQQPLVILERGRGANLSPIGVKLLNANLQLQARFIPELDNVATQFKQEFDSVLINDESSSLNIFASHGIAIDNLRELINQQQNFQLDLHFHGSLESLRALANGECDIAGFHIPDGKMAKPLTPRYLELLDQEQHQLIYVVKRNQGLMMQPGNPKNISSLKSLANDNVSFINRQTDSGTRLLFDQLLQAENITPSQVTGYQHEEFTHMAVAAMIASGVADAGFGIAPMAEKFKLDFLPLIWEHYCLAVPRKIAHDSRVAKIIELLQSDKFKQGLAGSAGYDTTQTGNTIGFKKLFP
ncbi:LysR family transcriptional regulator [Methylophaga sp. 42_25_T18]|nr:LysR family transcriptional regulator [Methylophaga sp. 42_25_T18]OUR85949.1 LysR family transcriptional regulator [Methylophaga sp. 42_8_T64]